MVVAKCSPKSGANILQQVGFKLAVIILGDYIR